MTLGIGGSTEKMKVRKILNICIAVIVPVAWLMMTVGGGGTLSENGIGNLKYFTVQSNIMEGIASVIWLVVQGGDEVAKARAELFKYISAASVMLTFTTVMVFLGPLYGYPMMLKGANLFFHLIVPLMAFAEMIFLTDADFKLRDNNMAAVPPLIYGALYLLNVIINGIGEWPDTNDWYLFLTWGYPTGILIFACICAVTWLIALLMRKFSLHPSSKRGGK